MHARAADDDARTGDGVRGSKHNGTTHQAPGHSRAMRMRDERSGKSRDKTGSGREGREAARRVSGRVAAVRGPDDEAADPSTESVNLATPASSPQDDGRGPLHARRSYQNDYLLISKY